MQQQEQILQILCWAKKLDIRVSTLWFCLYEVLQQAKTNNWLAGGQRDSTASRVLALHMTDLICLGFGLWATPSYAQGVLVGSGDHPRTVLGIKARLHANLNHCTVSPFQERRDFTKKEQEETILVKCFCFEWILAVCWID